jgi:hypothetical protein
MPETSERKMWLRWSYLPPLATGEPVSDPRSGKSVVTSLRHAVKASNVLKETLGDALLYVDVTIRLIDS